MYKVYAIQDSSSILIYNDVTPELTKTKLIDPKLTLEDNAAGSFTCKIPSGNAIYPSIKPMTTYIRITRDDTWMWSGRVLTVKRDMWLQKEITCEGALAYLNDVVLPQKKYNNIATYDFVQRLLVIYNHRAPGDRVIAAGAISSSTSSGSPIGLHDYVTQGESVMKHITTLAEDWGLHIRLRETDGILYLDMRTDDQLSASSQVINFGENLLDYADESDWSDLVTAIQPLGADLDTHINTGDEEYPDKLSLWGKTLPDSDPFGIDFGYLYNKSAVQTYGRIEETVEWSEVDDVDTLLELAKLYLNDYKYSSLRINVNVVDLHYLSKSTQGFQFLSTVRCVSKPHNLNAQFIIDHMEIPLNNPENTSFSFSRSTMGYYSADRPTQGYGRGTVSGMSMNVNKFSKASVLVAAKENARQMLNFDGGGYVCFNMDSDNEHIESISITEGPTMDESYTRWIWNRRGLGYQKRTSTTVDWGAPNVAITMDGAIVANFITTGVLQVASSGDGVLFSADMTNDTVHIAGFTVKGTALYTNDKSTMDSNTYGIYIGNDGISHASNGRYMCFSDGDIYGVYGGNEGYITFASVSAEDPSKYGLRLGGRSFLAFDVGNWMGVSESGWAGRFGDLSCNLGVSRSVTIDGTTLEFRHGLYIG